MRAKIEQDVEVCSFISCEYMSQYTIQYLNVRVEQTKQNRACAEASRRLFKRPTEGAWGIPAELECEKF